MPDMKIVVDSREPKWLHTAMQKFGAPVFKQQKALKIGDYETDLVIVERKGAADFIASIVDGRLFDQLNRLSAYCQRTGKAGFLFTHGNLDSAILEYNARIATREEALRAAKTKQLKKQGKTTIQIKDATRKIRLKRLNNKSVFGSLASIKVRYHPHISIIHTEPRNPDWVPYILWKIIEKAHEEKLGQPRKIYKKRTTRKRR